MERLATFFSDHLLSISVIIPYILAALMYVANITLEKRYPKPSKRLAPILATWKALYLPFTIFLVGYPFLNWGTFFCEDESESRSILLHLFEIGIVAWFFIRWKNILLEEMRGPKSPFSLPQKDILNKATTILVIFLSAMVALDATGTSLSTLLAFGGLGGVAFAWSAQESISNALSGLMLYLNHPFHVGEYIMLPSVTIEGTIEDIGWLTTRMRSNKSEQLYIPNSLFSKSIIANVSRQAYRDARFELWVMRTDQETMEKFRKTLTTRLDNLERLSASEVHWATWSQLAGDAALLEMRYLIYNEGVERHKQAVSDIIMAVWSVSEEFGITLRKPVIVIS